MSAKSIFLIFTVVLLFMFGCNLTQTEKSSKVEVKLMESETEVKYHIDGFVERDDMIVVRGWSFLEGFDTEEVQHYIVLKDNSDKMVFDAINLTRPDVTAYYESREINLDNSGFESRVLKDDLPKGEYNLGLYLVKGDETGLKYTNHYIRIDIEGMVSIYKDEAAEVETSNNDSIITSDLVEINIEEETLGVLFYFDAFEEKNNFLHASGWAFLDGTDVDESEKFIIFRSDDTVKTFTTEVKYRPDVTNFFENKDLNLDNSGFSALIPIEKLGEGEYQVGLYITADGEVGIVYSDILWKK